MSEATPERSAPLSPEERTQQIQLAKERAAAARAAREAGGSPQAASTPAAAETAAAASSTPAERAERAPVSAADRADQIRLAKERAEAARAARESGAAAAAAPPAAPAVAAAPGEDVAAAARPARAEPASPEDRAAAIEAAKQRAAAARAARDSGAPAPTPTAPAAARPAMSPEERAAALAQAQERAAAIRAGRASAAPVAAAAVATAPAEALPTWRIGPSGARVQVLTARPESRARDLAAIDVPARVVLKRRDFLRGGFWAGFAVLLVGSLSTFLDFFNPRDIHGFGGVVNIPAPSVPKPGDEPFHFLEGKTWLVNLKPGEGVPEQFQSVAAPSEKGGLLALYHKCVHLGCTVPWRSDFEYGAVKGWFRCPCHGSTYTKGGVRVFGPAPRSLDSFAITKVDQNGVFVNTGKITLGGTTDPQRAVPPGPFA